MWSSLLHVARRHWKICILVHIKPWRWLHSVEYGWSYCCDLSSWSCCYHVYLREMLQCYWYYVFLATSDVDGESAIREYFVERIYLLLLLESGWIFVDATMDLINVVATSRSHYITTTMCWWYDLLLFLWHGLCYCCFRGREHVSVFAIAEQELIDVVASMLMIVHS